MPQLQHNTISLLGNQLPPMTHDKHQAICSKALIQAKVDFVGFLSQPHGYVQCEQWHVLIRYFREDRITVQHLPTYSRRPIPCLERILSGQAICIYGLDF